MTRRICTINPMRITVIQTHPTFLNVEKNLIDVERKIKDLKTDLIVLPELFSSGYNFQTKKQVASVAEEIPGGPTSFSLQLLAKQKNCAIVAGLPEKSGNKFFNSALFVSPKEIQVYRKTHLFNNEKKFFTPGDLGLNVFTWKGIKIGVMICYDWFFPESMRTLALKGADIVAHPSNLVMPYCPEAMKTRSLENLVFSATANRVGTERNLTFIGSSQILSERGKRLGQLSKSMPGILTVEIDIKKARKKNIAPLNNIFKDRSPRFYI